MLGTVELRLAQRREAMAISQCYNVHGKSFSHKFAAPAYENALLAQRLRWPADKAFDSSQPSADSNSKAAMSPTEPIGAVLLVFGELQWALLGRQHVLIHLLQEGGGRR